MVERKVEPTLGIEWRVWGFTLYATDFGLGCHGYLLYDGEKVATISAGSGHPSVLFDAHADEAEDAWRAVAGRAFSVAESETVERLLHDSGLWPTSPDWQPTTAELTRLWSDAGPRSTAASARSIVEAAHSLTSPAK